jgi:hypothetical protein
MGMNADGGNAVEPHTLHTLSFVERLAIIASGRGANAAQPAIAADAATRRQDRADFARQDQLQ